MGNSPSSKEPPKFSWIGSGCVCADDLDIVWNHYSNHNKTIHKDDVAAFVEQVVKQYEEKRNGVLSLDEALILDNMNDAAMLPQGCDEISYKDFLKIFFTVLNKINITFSKDLREVYLKVGMEQNVYLHIYDLNENVSKLNDCTIHLGFGAFHTGVEIFNRELSFGYPNGIFICKPKQASTGAIYRKSVLMGTVSVTNQEFLEMIKAMKDDWKGEDYDVINANCNHFCNEMCMKLLNKSLPSYLTKIADFMSLFVKDSQDIGLFDGKGSMSFSQSQSLNGSLAGIGDVKGATDAFDEKNKVQPAETLNRMSSKNTLLPQLNIPVPEKKDAMNLSGEMPLESDSSKKLGRSSSSKRSSGTRSKNNSGGSNMLSNPNKRLSPSTSSNNITSSTSPGANNTNKRISPSNSSNNIHASPSTPSSSSPPNPNSKRLSPSTSSTSITPSNTPCPTPPSTTPPLTPHLVLPRESMHAPSTTKASSTTSKPKKKKDSPEEVNPTRLVSFAPDGKPEAPTTRFISLAVEVDEATKSKPAESSKTLNSDDKTPVLEQLK